MMVVDGGCCIIDITDIVNSGTVVVNGREIGSTM